MTARLRVQESRRSSRRASSLVVVAQLLIVMRWYSGVPTIRLIRQVFPMFPLTVDGLSDAVDVLRGAKPNKAVADPVADESRSFSM